VPDCVYYFLDSEFARILANTGHGGLFSACSFSVGSALLGPSSIAHASARFAGGTSIARMGVPGSDFWSIVLCGQICHLWQLKWAESGDAGGCCFFSSDSYGAGMVSPRYSACLGPLAVPARSGG
jgi:hypothetical protein